MASSAAPGVVFYSAAAAVRSDGGGSVEPRVPRGSPTDSRPPPPQLIARLTSQTVSVTDAISPAVPRLPSHVSLSPSLWVPGAHRHLSNTDANDSFNTRETCRLPDPRHRKQFRPASAPIWQPHDPLQFRPDVSLLPSTISHSIFLYTIH